MNNYETLQELIHKKNFQLGKVVSIKNPTILRTFDRQEIEFWNIQSRNTVNFQDTTNLSWNLILLPEVQKIEYFQERDRIKISFQSNKTRHKINNREPFVPHCPEVKPTSRKANT